MNRPIELVCMDIAQSHFWAYKYIQFITTKHEMPPKRIGHDFWRNDLRSARYVVAPMVDQSELAWRLMSRRHGAQLCYTPMLHASVFVKDARYRRENFNTCAEDRPLIVQFAANDPQVLVEAVRHVVGLCDGVDLNLGCPQSIAKKGHYGAFLQDEWDLIYKMVNAVFTELDIAITCKIRIFEDIEKTVRYAQMLEAAGCQLLTVHGRTREQKGPLTGVANWEHIKIVKKSVTIPVFANGNIQYLDDLNRCLKETGCEGVMTAEGNLHNPAIFEGLSPPIWQMAEEYLQIVQVHICPLSFVRGHLFKLCNHCLSLPSFQDLRMELAKANTLDGFCEMVKKLKERILCPSTLPTEYPKCLKYPPWVCQPYVRPSPLTEKDENRFQREPVANMLPPHVLANKKGLSKNKMKLLVRNPRKTFIRRKLDDYEFCKTCHNPKGLRCEFDLCRACCRSKCFQETLDCKSHRVKFRTKQLLQDEQKKQDKTTT